MNNIIWFKQFQTSNVYTAWANRCYSFTTNTFYDAFISQAYKEDIPIVNNAKFIFNCLNEGLGSKEINFSIQSLRDNGIELDIRVLFNSIITQDLPYRYRCLPTHMIAHCRFLRHVNNLNVNWKNIEVNRYFICLMRRPSVGRSQFAKQLLDRFKQEDFLLSCGCSSNYKAIVKDVQQAIHPYEMPILIDGKIGTDFSQHHHTNEEFFKCFINIIVETSSQIDEQSWSEIFLTEKTFKAFAYRQLPIWFAVPGTVKEVRNLGFDLFEDIIDHGYDNIQDHHTRIEAVVKTLRNFVDSYSYADLQKLRNDLWPRIMFNVSMLQKLNNENDKKKHQLMLELAE